MKMSKFRYDINAQNVCTILVTNECNIKCEFCVAENFVTKDGDFLSLDDLDKQIPIMAEKGAKFITLSGGEPSLSPDLHKITHKLYESGLFDGICIITNFTHPENLVKCVDDLSFIRVSLGVYKNKFTLKKINKFVEENPKAQVRVQVLLSNLKNGFSKIEDLNWLREHLDNRVTIACSTLRLANDWCIKHQADEDYWRAQGDETVTNRCIITLNDGTDIVLRTASVDITGEDPVEEEMVMSWDGSLHRGFKEIGYKLKSKEVK